MWLRRHIGPWGPAEEILEYVATRLETNSALHQRILMEYIYSNMMVMLVVHEGLCNVWKHSLPNILIQFRPEKNLVGNVEDASNGALMIVALGKKGTAQTVSEIGGVPTLFEELFKRCGCNLLDFTARQGLFLALALEEFFLEVLGLSITR